MWRLLHLCQALGEAVHPVSFEFLFRCFKTNARLPSVVQKPAWNYTPQGGIIPFRGGGAGSLSLTLFLKIRTHSPQIR